MIDNKKKLVSDNLKLVTYILKRYNIGISSGDDFDKFSLD
jgi:hypothetical protein